jgi:hypothetical protein
MKPERREIERLRRGVVKLKVERDILKAAAYFTKDRHEVWLHREAPDDQAGGMACDALDVLRSGTRFGDRHAFTANCSSAAFPSLNPASPNTSAHRLTS